MAFDGLGNLTFLLSAILIATGWYVTHKSNQRYEIFKVRLQKRMTLFDNVALALAGVADASRRESENPQNWADPLSMVSTARLEMQLYGLDDEVQAFEGLIEALEAADVEKFKERHNECV